MSNKKKRLSDGYRRRITQETGEGITVTPGPTDQPEHTKHFLAVHMTFGVVNEWTTQAAYARPA